MQKIVSSVLRELRNGKRWSQEQLATHAKVDKQTIHRIEKGKQAKPRKHTSRNSPAH
jgi:DNA-binding XRE family transcriptional regulator